MKVFATPNVEIMLGGGIVWEVNWQRKNEDMKGTIFQLPKKGWNDPLLKEVLPEDVIEAIIKKYKLCKINE